MKQYLLPLAFVFLFTGCESNKRSNEDESHTDTTVVIHKQEAEKPDSTVKENKPEEKKQAETKKEEPQPADGKPVVNWRPLMDEYHELLCRRHKGKQLPNDAIRQVELTKELNDARSRLPQSEQFEFATAMARAANMASCK